MIAFNHADLISLVQNRIPLEELQIGPVQLNKHYSCIDLFEIIDIYIEDPSVEGYNFGNSNFTIRERLQKLEKLDGHIHLAGGLACSIHNKHISSLRIGKKYMEPVTPFTRSEILQFHGTPDLELVDDTAYGGFDYAIEAYILVYPGKKLNFFIDPSTQHLTEIYTGELNRKYYHPR